MPFWNSISVLLATKAREPATHDTGAYYFGAHYAYNTLPRPAVHGFTVSPHGHVAFTPIRRAQSLAELVADAGGEFLGALPEA